MAEKDHHEEQTDEEPADGGLDHQFSGKKDVEYSSCSRGGGGGGGSPEDQGKWVISPS